MLLLRRTVAALRRAGHDVTLLAPAPAAVLVGMGAAHAGVHLDWDARDAATLMSGARLPAGRFAAALQACDVALAYTRSVALVHGLARVIPLTVAYDPAPAPSAGHASEWLARPLVRFGVDTSAPPPVLVPDDGDVATAREWLARLPPRFLAIHPGSGSPSKNWPFERFVALAEALRPDEPWLLVLGPAETALGAQAARARGDTAAAPVGQRPLRAQAHLPPAEVGQAGALSRAVVAGEPPLGTLLALLAHAGLYVGNDSGASHLAAACGTPTLALFGPTDPAVWSPVGPHVATLRAPGAQLAALDVETVTAAARALAPR